MFILEKPVILLVEDNEDDAAMIRRALKRASIELPLQVVGNGREAIAYLSGTGKYADPEFRIPALLLLDLHMPEVDGFAVLRWLRNQPHLNFVRVVVLTDSLQGSEAQKAYELGANSFLTKPADFNDTTRLVLLLIAQWLPAGLHRRVPDEPPSPVKAAA
jgi:CheY-like chemotaxis protein